MAAAVWTEHVGFVKGDIVVPCDNQLQFCGVGGEGIESRFVFIFVAVIRQVARVENDVCGGERVTVGMLCVGWWEGWGGVSIREDEDAGFDRLS